MKSNSMSSNSYLIDSFSTEISINLVEINEDSKHSNPYPTKGENPSVSKE